MEYLRQNDVMGLVIYKDEMGMIKILFIGQAHQLNSHFHL